MNIKSSFNNQQGVAVIIMAVLGLVLIGGLAGGGYYYMTVANKPAIVKQNIEAANPAFKDLSKSIIKLHENIVDSPSGSDPDSYERYAKESEDATDLAKKDLATLKATIDKIKISEMNDYKDALNKYVEKSQELITVGEENALMIRSSITIIRDYQTLTKSLSGISSYLYSDPARYVKEMRAAAETERKIMKDHEAIDLKGVFKDTHKLRTESYKMEVDFFEAMATAVENRDSNAVVSAQKDLQTKGQDYSEDYSRANDALDKAMADLKSELEDLKDTVEEEYDQLKSQYKI